MGMKQIEDQSRQEKEGGAKGQAKCNREVIWACSEVLDLDKGNMMEKLDKELASDVLLIGGKSFNDKENGGRGDGKGIEGVDVRCWK